MKKQTLKMMPILYPFANSMKQITCLLFLLPFFLTGQAQLERDSVQIIMDLQELKQPKLADLDGDGDPDMIGTRLGYDGHLAFYENTDGQGTLALPKIFGDSVWGIPTPYYNFELADMDNDGDIDIVDGRRAKSSYPFWQNDGQANFSLIAPPAPDDDGLRDYYPFIISDLNGDGYKDILHYINVNRRLYVNWHQGPNQAFELEEIAFLNFNNILENNELLVADFDQDGDQDIWVISTFAYDPPDDAYKTLKLELLEMENGAVVNTHEVDLDYAENPEFRINASTPDLNQDGFPDLVITKAPFSYPNQSGLLFFRNVGGNGNFLLQNSLPDPIFHTVADVNADGNEDIIVLLFDENNDSDDYNYQWLENNGTFELIAHQIDTNFTGYHLTTGDLNQDGLLDLVTTNTINSSLILTKDQSQVFCRYGTGNPGNFASPTPLTEAFSYMRDFTVKDWNGDGLADVLFAAESGISWIENLESGTDFSPPSHVWKTTTPLGAFSFDLLNQDELPDGFGTLPIAGSHYWQPFVWIGDTTDAPSPPIFFTNLQLLSADDYALGDLDGDADQDILLAVSDGSLVFIWNESDVGGSFSTEMASIALPEASSASRQLMLGDVNQDGNADLVIHSTNKLYYALQLDNAGTFEDWHIISGPSVSGPVLVGDYDNDGDLDLRYKVSENYDSYAVLSLFDAETQQFLSPISTLVFDIPHLWWQEDFNSDGIPDAVLDEGYSLSIGNSGFITEPYIPSPFHRLPYSLIYNPQKADLDNDGRDELITGITSLISYDLDFLESTTAAGLVVWDTTANCTFDSLHPPLHDWKLLLTSGTQQQLTTSGVNGQYGLFVPDFDEHNLQIIPPSDYWNVCPSDTTLTSDGPYNVHFTATANTLCPLMELDMSVSAIRQCFPSTVSLSYQNKGTVPATPVSITVTYDPRMTPTGSTPPWTSMTDTSLVFLFDEIGVGEDGQITIDMEPDCQNLILGEILCYKAMITPDTLCEPMLIEWGGPNLEASSFCETDSLAFRIENTGYGSMNTPESFQLNIVNDDIVLLQMGDVQLAPGEADTIRVATSTENYLLTVDQPDGHPNPEPISIMTGGCLAPVDNSLLNAFPNNNGDGFSQEICGPVVGPYDPNIKVAIPEGFGNQYLIKAEQAIKYTIHFQNIGTDMARQVTIRDTLSNQLDLATFQPGPASHLHEWAILPDRSLTITFPEINLPDSTSNEPGSHGHFSFTIKPVEGILPYTVIQNEAAIYFDFNPPVITNQTNHTILKPVVSNALYATLCPGDTYNGQIIAQDTILKEIHEMLEQDSVIWHHLNVLTLEDTTHVAINLNGPGEWQGQFIQQDTLITETLMSTLGCDSIVTYQIMILTDVQEPDWASNVQLSPNPTHSVFQLSWKHLPQSPKTVRVYQVTGQVMETRALTAADQNVSWDASQWASGSYWVELEVEGEKMRWRVVVI